MRAALIAAVALLAGSGFLAYASRAEQRPGVPSAATASKERPAQALTFIPYVYVDPAVGMEAFRLLIPKGWRVDGGVTWGDNPALPAQSRFRFFNPQGAEQFEIFPTQSYFWTNNSLFLATNPPGTLRFGTLVAAPLDLNAAFSRVLFPLFRAGLRDFQVLKHEPVPELGKLATGPPAPGVQASADAGKVRFVYEANGQPFEEEMYAAVSQFVTPMPGSMMGPPYFIDYWFIDYVFSFRATRGQLDDNARIFQTMVFSMRMNPHWFAKVVNTKEQMAQMIIRGIKAIGHAGQVAAQASSDLREEQQAAWEQRQVAKDKAAEDFSDYILGVQRFTDPYAEKEVQLPSGYGYAWANDLGEYIVTDSPSYNPNIGSNQSWQQMPTAR